MRTARLVLLVTLLGACGASQRGEPAAPPLHVTSPEVARGRIVFDHLCYKCHPGGEQGLGIGLNDKPLPEAFVRTQIRTGGGAMPAFSKHDLSEQDLGAVAAYVHALRKAPAGGGRYAGR